MLVLPSSIAEKTTKTNWRAISINSLLGGKEKMADSTKVIQLVISPSPDVPILVH